MKQGKKTFGLAASWKSILIAATSAVLLVGAEVGCHGTTANIPGDGSTAATDASSTVGAAAVGDVAPPPPVVSEDPEIPLHESVVGSAPVAADYFADTAPPEAIVEDPPPMPAPNQVWIPGYWWWSRPLARYVWVTGAWRSPPPEQTWSPGSWVLAGTDRYVWSPGFWAPRGFVRESAVIDIGPPVMRVDVVGPRPDPAFIWTPGYYAYREGSYASIGGSWVRPPSVGLGWVEPRYVGFGGRFCFQPGRWDFAPALRGTVYVPDTQVRVGGHLRPVPVPVGVVAAHVSYVSASARAIAQGATRTSTGGYVVRGGVARPPGGGEPHGPVPEIHGGVAPSHAGWDTHGANTPPRGFDPQQQPASPARWRARASARRCRCAQPRIRAWALKHRTCT